MPEESKKTQHKGPRDQRKPRNRHQAGATEKKVEKKTEEIKVPVPQKPVYEEPGPEFYKNLKRETDEILKITEEANSKYKKKEIQSNWSKYEMPIESYDEIEKQENMGADYEKLIEAPLSVGGHFQFKHEKSWDVDTGPSLYDKYFEVDMDNLFLSITTIPFHERIDIDKSIFSETDMLSMNNRATRHKQKYYNDKAFMTPELTTQDNIIAKFKDNVEKDVQDNDDDKNKDEENNQEQILINETLRENLRSLGINEIKAENGNIKSETGAIANASSVDNMQSKVSNTQAEAKSKRELPEEKLDNFEDFILDIKIKKPQTLKPESFANIKDYVLEKENAVADKEKYEKPEEQNNPVIESPEDLEKWLDDFLDG